jgi:hypothetical protein
MNRKICKTVWSLRFISIHGRREEIGYSKVDTWRVAKSVTYEYLHKNQKIGARKSYI